MSMIDDDDRPTVAGNSGGGFGRSSGSRERETRLSGQPPPAGRSQPRETEERPTIVRPRGPEINSVAWLYCRKGLRKGHLYQLRKERNELGRAVGLELEIEDEMVGNHHGAILLDEGVWKIFDFASKNGTLVNDKKLGVDSPNPVPLEDGDVVTLGDTELIFKKV